MRVVVVTPALPLPFGRADARWLYVILKGLTSRQVDVTCVSCTEEPPPRVDEAMTSIRPLGVEFQHVPLELSETTFQRKLSSLARPFSEFGRVRALDDAVHKALAPGYDIIHIEHLFTAWALLGVDRSVTYLHHLEVVDWEGRPAMPARDRLTYVQMSRATKRILGGLQRVVVASPRLEDEVRRFGYGGDLAVCPVALDPDLYPHLGSPRDLTVGVIGSMNWYPSRSAAERVLTRLWPRIHSRVPDSRLVVAGWNADRYLGHLFPIPGAELVGEVLEPTQFFSKCDVLLYPPSKGSGMKIKVLEAMAYGVPVVSNREGLEGLEPLPEDGPILAESDDEFIEATVSVLTDPTRAARMAEEGRRLLEERFSIGPAIDQLFRAYEQIGLIQ